MGSNDLYILDAHLEKRRRETAAQMTPDDFFTMFVAELALRTFQPGLPAVLAGVVDGPHDCGIDAIYCFINGQLLTQGVDVSRYGRKPEFSIQIFQTKRSQKFTEDVLDKFQVHLPELLTFARDEEGLRGRVNPLLLDSTRLILDAIISVAHANPIISFNIHYATRADRIHPNTVKRGETVARSLESLFPGSVSAIRFYTPRDLVTLSRTKETVQKELPVASGPISSASDRGQGYVCLVRLEDLHRFVCEEGTEELHTTIFEANVRDHHGESLVNKSIHETLSTPDSPDFWWLNNGITIIAPEVRHMGTSLYLEDPQIVNGLQTSHEVYRYFKAGGEGEGRLIMIRVICASDEASRDLIIRATNNQNVLPASALRATDRLQRNIEEFLSMQGLVYDRRKDSYRHLADVHVADIVSIEFMAQCMTACLLMEPWRSRGQVAGLLEDATYHRIFAEDIPLASYVSVLRLVRRIRDLLEGDRRFSQSKRFLNDYLYHVATASTILLTRKSSPSAQDLVGMDAKRINMEAVEELLALVAIEYAQFMGQLSFRPEASAAADQRTSEALVKRISRMLQSTGATGWPEQRLRGDFRRFGSEVVYRGERRRG